MTLHISTITAVDALRDLRGEWLRLLERTQGELPFFSPEWHVCWWEAFQQRGPLISDALRVKVVRDGADTLVGIIPLMLTERPCRGPVRARTLGFLGVDQFVTELQAPIVDPSCEGEIARVLGTHLLASKEWDWIAWQGMDRASPFARELEATLGLRWGKSEAGNLLKIAPSWDEFRKGLKRNIKESLRHCYNSLKREGLTPRLVVAETAEEIERDLPRFFKLHSMRSEQTGTVTHPDRFASARVQRFLGAVCERLAERRVARVFTLEVGDVAVASRVAFRLPDMLYLYYSGVDPAWGRYGVATTLVAEAIKYAMTLGVSQVHLSMGVDVSKSRWNPETPVHHQAVSLRSRVSSRAAFKVYSWARNNPLLEGAAGRLLPKRRFDGEG
jgi:CelD/BcsL family acetyltransferase involved in cellulose biosynthesis